MKKILNFIQKFLRFLLSLINIVLIVIIVLNVVLIISQKLLKQSYPTLMDYTYKIMEENKPNLNLTKNDILIIDTRKAYNTQDIVMYQEDNQINLGQINVIEEKSAKIKNENKEITVSKENIKGTVIKIIPKFGENLNKILAIKSLIICIVVLTITSIIQNLLSKQNKKYNQEKPNFEQMKTL